MTRLRGIPLNSDRATFEAYEQRVEDAALARHLDTIDDPKTIAWPPHPTPCDRYLALRPCAGSDRLASCGRCKEAGAR